MALAGEHRKLLYLKEMMQGNIWKVYNESKGSLLHYVRD